MRQRSLENILETGSTLSSLAQLISQIANIVIRFVDTGTGNVLFFILKKHRSVVR
jgi:Phosphatidylinositol-glycan biosynthesis class S protein